MAPGQARGQPGERCGDGPVNTSRRPAPLFPAHPRAWWGVTVNSTDVIVVGSGLIGLAHAVEAYRRGSSVRVIERDSEPVGASVRNFGHACLTAQAPEHAERLTASRAGWLDAAASAGFWAQEAGAVFVARSAPEVVLVEAT